MDSRCILAVFWGSENQPGIQGIHVESLFIPWIPHGIHEECMGEGKELQTANLLIREVFKRFRLPDKIISDRGPQFAAAAFQEVMKALKIKHSMSTTFHPQTDGQTECLNQELEVYLHIFCANEPHT